MPKTYYQRIGSITLEDGIEISILKSIEFNAVVLWDYKPLKGKDVSDERMEQIRVFGRKLIDDLTKVYNSDQE